jgi:hypothetical protein
MDRQRYTVIKKPSEYADFSKMEIWESIPPISIDKYKWMDNKYTPTVRVRVFHTASSIYLYYHVPESRITVKRTSFGSEVWKDSCVEFFLNPFPESSDEYVNMEFNALGVMLIGIGKDGDDSKRYYFKQNEVGGFETISSIKQPVTGSNGSDHWQLFVKVPKGFFEKRYKKTFTDKATIANFNKCGDETEFEHYGSWNEIVNPTPNFHLPQYFGELIFSR